MTLQSFCRNNDFTHYNRGMVTTQIDLAKKTNTISTQTYTEIGAKNTCVKLKRKTINHTRVGTPRYLHFQVRDFFDMMSVCLKLFMVFFIIFYYGTCIIK